MLLTQMQAFAVVIVVSLTTGDNALADSTPRSVWKSKCPPKWPQELCFGDEKYVGIVDWSKYDIPLATSLNYTRTMLQSAVEIEHSTIPLYLTSMYSIINTSSFAYSVIKSVVIEEMLHMTQAANILNAVGGHPSIDQPNFIPSYPILLPVVNISASIRRFNQISVRNFLEIERPPLSQMSITDCYNHITQLISEMCRRYGERSVFIGDRSLQVQAYAPGLGESALPIYTLNDAIDALNGVADQGGGCAVPGSKYSNTSAGPLGGGLAHWARFTEILEGRMYGPNDTAASGPRGDNVPIDFNHVYTFDANPSVSNFAKGTQAYEMSLAFASNYTSLLVSLHNVFNGQPNNLMSTLGQMYALKELAIQLMTTDDPRKLPDILGIGPPWEYVPAVSEFYMRGVGSVSV